MTTLTAFTPWAALCGGALIGLAAVLLMALHGRILGATGILSGLLS
ncbi:YeeE/YedE family protein, partial [Thioclava sp. BHET1]